MSGARGRGNAGPPPSCRDARRPADQPSRPGGLACDGQRVWAGGEGRLVGLNPTSGAVETTAGIEGEVTLLASGGAGRLRAVTRTDGKYILWKLTTR